MHSFLPTIWRRELKFPYLLSIFLKILVVFNGKARKQKKQIQGLMKQNFMCAFAACAISSSEVVTTKSVEHLTALISRPC